MKRKARILNLAWIALFTLSLVLSGCGGSSSQGTNATAANTNHQQAATANNANEITLVTGEYEPYTSQHLPGYGLFTEIVTSAFKAEGITCKYEFYPWARGEDMVKSGQRLAIFPYDGPNAERAKTMIFSNGVLNFYSNFFVLKGNPKIKSDVYGFTKLQDFKGYTFGGAPGYFYGTEQDVKKLGIKTDWLPDTQALMKMLLNQRIDFFIEDPNVVKAIAAKVYSKDQNQFVALKAKLNQGQYILMFSKKFPNSTQYRDKFNEGLQKIKANGEYDKILKQHGLE
jgi:polar amino acid transport system substrate-binding protein